jgi:hypothetical protein
LVGPTQEAVEEKEGLLREAWRQSFGFAAFFISGFSPLR